ncbi:MAG: flotillin-like FloA family protein, partial [Spirochaetales bacterium]|nr:flotillin-like FloA family protein [Spirochaetales bacterium]
MIILYILIGVVAVGFAAIFLKFFGLWFRAVLSGAHITIGRLVGMWIRRVKGRLIVDSRIMLAKGGIKVDSDQLETHYLAGGDVVRVSKALIAANKADIPLNFQRAAAIDLAGRDVLDAVKTSVNPKVIDCPTLESGKGTIDAVAKDGIQLRA